MGRYFWGTQQFHSALVCIQQSSTLSLQKENKQNSMEQLLNPRTAFSASKDRELLWCWDWLGTGRPTSSIFLPGFQH